MGNDCMLSFTFYNQGQKSLDRLSLFSFIHPFTVLTLIFCLFSSGIVTPNPCIQMQFPLPTPCFNVALNSGVRASTIWINIEDGERGKSLVITPQWSNTFGPDCRLIYFWRNMSISSIFYFSKSTSINTQYSSLWDTLEMMLFTKYFLKWKCIGRISWNFRHCSDSKFSVELDIKRKMLYLSNAPLIKYCLL